MTNEINKLFGLMGLDFDAITSAMLKSMVQNINEKIPGIPDSFWDKYRNNLNTESLRIYYEAIYQRHYTPEEIAGLIAFYETPLGRKSAIANQQIVLEGQAVTNAYLGLLATEAVQEIFDEDDDDLDDDD